MGIRSRSSAGIFVADTFCYVSVRVFPEENNDTKHTGTCIFPTLLFLFIDGAMKKSTDDAVRAHPVARRHGGTRVAKDLGYKQYL